MQHAHDHHLIHQDVKPSNFLVRNRLGHVLPDLLLMDFGIAKIATATATASQSVRGTPAFMAPEQWDGQPQPATDQYALAVVAYLLLTGRTPFTGRMEQVMRQHFTVQPQPPSSFNPDISPALDAVILHALEKEPAKRFPSIFAFAQAFQEALQAGSDQDAAVIAPKKEEASTVPDETTEPEEVSLAASAPLSSTISPKKGSSIGRSRLILVLSVVVLVVIASVIGVSISANQRNQMNASATAQANDDATSTEQAKETATAQTQARATAQVIANNPYPSYLSGSGTLAFVDPLSQESGSQWSSYNGSGGGCQFIGGAYQGSEQQSNLYRYCSTGATFSNFAFEVQLTISQGDCGGMIFPSDGNENYYYFQVCQNGSYEVSKHVSHSGSTNLGYGNSSAIHSGLGQQNKIALVANGSSFTFYVNEQQVSQLQDGSYTSGRIGLVASDHSQATDVAYSNARLWRL